MKNVPKTQWATNRGVLIIVENLPVPFDRRVWQEATALKDSGYAVSVICPKGKDNNESYECLNGIHIYRHTLPFEASGALGFLIEYSSALFWEFWLSLVVLRRHGFDAIHACNPPDLIFLVAQFHKILFRKKFVFDHHDICPELYEAKSGKRGFFFKLLRLFERLTFKSADICISTNETLKAIASERCAVPKERISVVKSYPQLSQFKSVRPDASLRNGRSHLIGYVGIMGNQDGVDILVHAMSEIVNTQGRQDIQCHIIGDGPELENLVELSKKLRLENHISFAGYLSGKTLLTHLSSLDVGVIPDPPNAYNDKISMNKVFEYMSLGLPIVQFNLTESRITAGEAALTVNGCTPADLASGIVELIADPNQRAEMSRRGAERAEKEFSWDREKDVLVAAYDNLFEIGSRTSALSAADEKAALHPSQT